MNAPSEAPLDHALRAGDLAACVDRYRPGSSAERYEALRQRLAKDRFVVPVYGVQGSGKSTLLNALAFDLPVLPVDVDETTCIPTEIERAKSSSARATVLFKDGRSSDVPCDEDGLRGYVHQSANPGNQLGVDRIVTGSEDSLLANGLVLVDLPGLGSLTAANAETTERYMREATAVVFMLRTVPTLTRTETARIGAVWARTPTAFFVQNVWNDESSEEAREGAEHNRSVLRELAAKLHLQDAAVSQVCLVNAYRAHRARLQGDAREALDSGLSTARDLLERASTNWPHLIRTGVHSALRQELAAVLVELDRLEGVLGSDREKAAADVERERQNFDGYFEDLSHRRARMSALLRKYVVDEGAWIQAWSASTTPQLRNTMRAKMRRGVVDGARLQRSLFDEQTVARDEVFCDFEERAFAIRDLVQQQFEGVAAWEGVAPRTQRTVHVEESTKYENAASPVTMTAAALGGAKLGAALGTIGGPIGVGIGAAVGGMLGGLFGGWVGRKVTGGVTGYRADKVEPVVFAAIDQFCGDTAGELQRSAETLAADLDRVVREWSGSQHERYQQERDRSLAALRATESEKGARLELILRDRALVTGWFDRIGSAP